MMMVRVFSEPHAFWVFYEVRLFTCLDVTSTGVLVVQREGHDETKEVRFTLVGTMNPSEGGLRPQLLDRFGLMADVVAESEDEVRLGILQAVLNYDAAVELEKNGQSGESLVQLNEMREKDKKYRDQICQSKARLKDVELAPEIAKWCAGIGRQFGVEGHRGDYIIALAACARAALRSATRVELEDLLEVAPLVLQHRRSNALQAGGPLWTSDDSTKLHQWFTA